MLGFEHALLFELEVITQSSEFANLKVRGMTRDGTFSFPITTNNTQGKQTFIFGLTDIPIFLSVDDVDQVLVQGDTYVVVWLRVNKDRLHILTSGLIAASKGISYPTANTQDPMPARGRFRVITLPDPAAGVEIIDYAPANIIWHVLSVRLQLVAAAVAVSRRVHFVFSVGAHKIDCFGTTDQLTGETKNYSLSHYGQTPDETDSDDILVNLPSEIWLQGDNSFSTETTNLQATDNFGAATMYVEEYFRSSV